VWSKELYFIAAMLDEITQSHESRAQIFSYTIAYTYTDLTRKGLPQNGSKTLQKGQQITKPKARRVTKVKQRSPAGPWLRGWLALTLGLELRRCGSTSTDCALQ